MKIYLLAAALVLGSVAAFAQPHGEPAAEASAATEPAAVGEATVHDEAPTLEPAGESVAAAEPAAPEMPAPHLLLRPLQEVQNRIAAGKTSARDDQPKLIAEIGRQFAGAPQSVWKDPRNARAAALFALSGGSPRVLRQILRGGGFAHDEQKLALGALAYAEGRAERAHELLVPIDALSVDPILGAQLALVQASLVIGQNTDKALRLLGIARLLAPGTLVEETALRRQISVVGQTSDAERFAELARQYARRFKQSLYAQDFRNTFAAALVRIGSRAQVDDALALEPVLSTFDRDERCKLAIVIAKTTLLQGSLKSAAAFSDIVMRPPVEDSCDVVRARLYRAASQALNPEADAALMAIEKLDPSRLSREDAALRLATLKLAALTRSWPQAREPEPLPPGSPPSPTDTLIAQAQAALEATDELLKRKSR